MQDYTHLTESELDAAWAAYYDANMIQAANEQGLTAEIIKRQSHFVTWVGGLIGMDFFPKFTARGGFNAVDTARQSVYDSTGNLIAGAGQAAKAAVAAAQQTIIVVAIAAAVVASVFLLKVKK